jgi:hypothetical protein
MAINEGIRGEDLAEHRAFACEACGYGPLGGFLQQREEDLAWVLYLPGLGASTHPCKYHTLK